MVQKYGLFTYISQQLHVVVQPNFRRGRIVWMRSHFTHGAQGMLDWATKRSAYVLHVHHYFLPKMATARSLCKVCRSFLSTNVILYSQTGQTSAKVNSTVGLEFGRCFINVFWFSFCDLFRPQAMLKNQHRQLIEWHM